MSNKQLPADVQETQYPIKWEVKSHSYQIADTGDYDGYWEITNGKDSLITREDYDEIEKDLQAVVDLLNNTYANFTVDRGAEAALEAENKWLNEIDQLRQWKMEAVKLQMPIIAYCHKHLEHNIGDSCTALVIAELDRLREENAALRAQTGAVWVKAVIKLPQANESLFVKIEGKKSVASWSPYHQMFVDDTGDFHPADQVEWWDESGAASPLNQERADLIREANNRDLEGAAAHDLQHELALSKEVNKEALALTEKAQLRLQDLKDKGDKLYLSLLRIYLLMDTPTNLQDNPEFKHLVSIANEALRNWVGGMPKLEDGPLLDDDDMKAWEESEREDKA